MYIHESSEITADEYQKKALRTQNTKYGQDNPSLSVVSLKLAEGLMGLNGEAGEAMDILKKHMFQGHVLDVEHMARELGDVAWYLAVSADAIGYPLSAIFEINIDKLNKRYPDGFDTDKSVNREKGDI